MFALLHRLQEIEGSGYRTGRALVGAEADIEERPLLLSVGPPSRGDLCGECRLLVFDVPSAACRSTVVDGSVVDL